VARINALVVAFTVRFRNVICQDVTPSGKYRREVGCQRSSEYCIVALVLPETSFLLQSDRQPGDDRGQIEVFGETQIGTFDDKFAMLAIETMVF